MRTIFGLLTLLTVGFLMAQEPVGGFSFSAELNYYQGVGNYKLEGQNFSNATIAGSFLGAVHYWVAPNFALGIKSGYGGNNDPVRSTILVGLDLLKYKNRDRKGWFSQLSIGSFVGQSPRYAQGGFLEVRRGYAMPLWRFRIQPSLGLHFERINDQFLFIRDPNGGPTQVLNGDINLIYLSAAMAILFK